MAEIKAKIVDLSKVKIQKLKNAYKQGENNNIKEVEYIKILDARKKLLSHYGLSKYENEINIVTNFFYDHRNDNREFDIIYLVFTKALDFILTNDDNKVIKRKFVIFNKLLYKFIMQTTNMTLSKEIKMACFDLQSVLLEKYERVD